MGWDGIGWSPGGVKYRAAYAANKQQEDSDRPILVVFDTFELPSQNICGED